MRISLCIPCRNRADDLAAGARHFVEACNGAPPAEVAVLDYGGDDDVRAAVEQMRRMRRREEVIFTYSRYEGRDYYHMSHAWNLAVKCSSGDYVALMGADARPSDRYLVEVRALIDRGAQWIRARHFKGIVCVERALFYRLGGLDERMEFYGSEDKDLEQRLVRSGATFGLLPDGVLSVKRTPNTRKVKGYRLPLTKAEMCARNRRYFEENKANKVLMVNVGKEWGAWD